MITLSSVKKPSASAAHSVDVKDTVRSAIRRLRYFGDGAFYGLQAIGNHDSMGFPVYRVSGRERHNEWGKGLTEEQCQASALMERVERISADAKNHECEKIKSTSFNNLDRPAISRREFGLCNVHHLLYDEKQVDDIRMDWVTADSLGEEKQYLVPAQLATFRYPMRGFRDYHCSTGLASGNTFEGAIMHAYCEVIERHVLHKMIFNRPKVNEVDLSTVKTKELQETVSMLRQKGFTVKGYDLSDGWGVSTAGIHIVDPSEKILFEKNLQLGTAPHPEQAFLRAITELAQNRAVLSHWGRFSKDSRGFPEGAPEQAKREHEWLECADNTISMQDMPDSSSEDILEEIHAATKDTQNKGYRFLIHDLTNQKLKLPVAKVMIPGVQPNFHMLGYHPLAKEAIVTSHLDIYEDVMRKVKEGKFVNQQLTERVTL